MATLLVEHEHGGLPASSSHHTGLIQTHTGPLATLTRGGKRSMASRRWHGQDLALCGLHFGIFSKWKFLSQAWNNNHRSYPPSTYMPSTVTKLFPFKIKKKKIYISQFYEAGTTITPVLYLRTLRSINLYEVSRKHRG